MARFAICEWICGGGFFGEQENPELVCTGTEKSTLLQEGWSMLQHLAVQLAILGHQVVAPLRQELIFLAHESTSRSNALQDIHFQIHGDWTYADVVARWSELADACDQAILIAPETDQILQHLVSCMRSGREGRLFNCYDPCLTIGCDKLLTARAMQNTDLAHPETATLEQLIHKEEFFADREHGYVIKPRFGAGCDGLVLFSSAESLRSFVRENRPATVSPLICQPRIPGSAYSKSAVVDRKGQWTWFPMVTQEFHRRNYETPGAWTLEYKTAALVNRSLDLRFTEQYATTISKAFGAGAVGWINLDLLYDQATDQWTLIEINPRCSTSMIALDQLSEGQVVRELAHAALS